MKSKEPRVLSASVINSGVLGYEPETNYQAKVKHGVSWNTYLCIYHVPVKDICPHGTRCT